MSSLGSVCAGLRSGGLCRHSLCWRSALGDRHFPVDLYKFPKPLLGHLSLYNRR